MKKVIKVVVILFFILVWLILVGYTQFYIPKEEITFTESEHDLVNPSRGFYVQFDSEDVEDMIELRPEGITLALVGFDIRDYVDREISSDKLVELQEAFETAQENGIKVIFRAAYGFDSEFKYLDSKDLEMVFTHIEQIAPIINRYKHIILSVQAGFLGPWGEWHSSNLLSGEEEQKTAVRNALINKLLETLDESIIVNVRRPRFLRDALDAGMDLKRLGVHNDALLSTNDDMGTYDDLNFTRAMELEWLERNLSHSIHGGEMPLISEFSVAEQAIMEFQQLNLTYLNGKYNKEVINTWMSSTVNGENAYDVINQHLGYRLSIKKAYLPKYIKRNRPFQFKIELHNSGYAAIPYGYTLSLIIKSQSGTIAYPLRETVLQKIEGGSNFSFQYKVDIPSDYLVDTLEIGFMINGLASEFTQDDFDSVMLANNGFNYEAGVNYFATYEREDDTFELK